MPDLTLRARRVIFPDGERAADIELVDGQIAAILAHAGSTDGPLVEVGDDCVLLPGLVDSHVHVNEPGRTEWEGFATATAAAAAGGVTTIVDMPLNSIPATVDEGALTLKRAAAVGRVHVDVGFWAGAVPGNVVELAPLHRAGVVGFKCFLVPSGVPEFGHLDQAGLVAAMTEIARFDGLLIAHAEDPAVLAAAPYPDGRSYRGFLDSRPAQAEQTAIGGLISAMRQTGCRAHIVHLSAAAALPVIAAARDEGLPLTVETCPHYLTLAAEAIPDGATAYKCCPPIRDEANRMALWQGLADGIIDCIVSDHSPCTTDLKDLETGDFGTAWGGIASLQLGLPLIWTEASRQGYSLPEVVRWMSSFPAQLTGLVGKGKIELGAAADFAVFAPDEWWEVDPLRLKHRNLVTPYTGARIRGYVRQTWLHGVPVHGLEPAGRLLTRNG